MKDLMHIINEKFLHLVVFFVLSGVFIGLFFHAFMHVYATGTNLILNPSVETSNGTAPLNWTSSNWGTNTTTFSYPNTGAQDGIRSVMVTVSSYSNGDAKWIFDPVTVTGGTQYTISDYYKSNTTTYFVGQSQDVNGKYSYFDIATLPATTSWTQKSVTFTTPASAVKLTVFHLIESVGTLQTDNYSLTAGSVAPTPTPTPTPTVIPTSTPTPTPTPLPGNIVPNASVEQSSGTVPTEWQTDKWGTNTTTFNYLNTGHTGSKSVQVSMSSYKNGDAKWYFTPQAVTPNTTYKFSDYYQSTVVNYVTMVYTLSDGSASYVDLGEYDPSTSWKQINGTFTTPANAVELTIYHMIQSVGSLTTDDYSITPVTSNSFTRPIISLTFDDGPTSQYTNALPVLNQLGLHGTFYIISSYPGTTGYMPISQIAQIQQAGNEIGSHTVDHPYLTSLTQTQIIAELSNSQTTLQNNFGPVANFATPYGDYDETVIRLISRYYRSHRTSTDGINTRATTNVYQILTKVVVNTTSTADVQSWIDQAKQQNAWLVLEYHIIDTSSFDQYYLTPSAFQAQMQAIKNSQVAVETMDQAITEITPQLP